MNVHLHIQHPVLLVGIGVLAILAIVNIAAHLRGRISWRTVHHRPQEYLPYAALVAEVLHLYKGC